MESSDERGELIAQRSLFGFELLEETQVDRTKPTFLHAQDGCVGCEKRRVKFIGQNYLNACARRACGVWGALRKPNKFIDLHARRRWGEGVNL